MKRVFERLAAITAILSVILMPGKIQAQSGVLSPYSRYGIGLLSDQSTGITQAMGGVGAGFREENTLNLKNPASYSAVDTLTFVADLGLSLQNANFAENGVKLNARNAFVDHMAMQFRIRPRIGMTVGFTPFSNVGYQFSNTQVVRRDEDGEIKATNTYSGSGGVRQFVVGLGWRPTDWLSVGANGSYLSGDITHQIYNSYSSSDVQSRVKTYDAEMGAFKVDFGAQGTIKMGDDNRLVLGVTYSPAQKLESEVLVTDIHSSSDTITLKDAFKLPEQISAGFSYKWKNMTLAADMSYQNWSKALFFGEEGGSDRMQAAMGFMIRPDESSRNILMHSAYQVGVHFAQPYIKVGNSKGPMEYGVSAGFSVPFTNAYNSMSYLHVSAQYTRIQPQVKGMITENYLGINIGVTFLERWFMKLMVE
ncbi:MAG: hypothetical protein J5705_06775 [Bacteroidaceae bacterium]|nr:hypothetical protein [Bacteroidaceae bacterium]